MNFLFSNEVSEALRKRTAIVALESTIISHGMPYPDNVATAKAVENVIRQGGATPATIAILGGRVCIGLSNEQLETLGKLGTKCLKVSRRDVAHCVALGLDGATTVSATMLLAHRAGISIFVTGGIGGVHRGAPETFDISADLTELGRTPVCVVCAGAKSILDIGLTLENLETNGVTVVGFGVEEMPAFFTRKSGFKVPLKLDTELDCAKLIESNSNLNLNSGMLVCVPIPIQHEANGSMIEETIQKALHETIAKNISGRDLTPYLLKRVNELSKGESLKSNVQLVLNNARVGAGIAVQLAQLRSQSIQSTARPIGRRRKSVGVVVVGGIAVDIVGRSNNKPLPRDSNPGQVEMKPGGVGRNMAHAIHRAASRSVGGSGDGGDNDVSVRLVSMVGDDMMGQFVRDATRRIGIDVNDVAVTTNARTAIYHASLDELGEMQSAVADMSIFDELTPDTILARLDTILKRQPPIQWLLIDANFNANVIKSVLEFCRQNHIQSWFEPTSVAKCVKIVPFLSLVDVISPNEAELRCLAQLVRNQQQQQQQTTTIQDDISTLTKQGTKIVLAHFGSNGCVIGYHDSNELDRLTARKIDVVRDVTGAGDCLVCGTLNKLQQHENLLSIQTNERRKIAIDAVECGMRDAERMLRGEFDSSIKANL